MPQVRTEESVSVKVPISHPKVNDIEEVPEDVFRISQVGTGTCALTTMEVGMESSQFTRYRCGLSTCHF